MSGGTRRQILPLIMVLVVVISFIPWMGEGKANQTQTFTGVSTTFTGWGTAYTWTNEEPPDRSTPVIVLALIIIVILAIVVIRLFAGRRQPMRVFCAQCGAENPPANEFCGKCGQKLRQ
jgi:ribosomal protein L40E